MRVRSIGDDDLIEPLTLANAQKRNKKYYKRRTKRVKAYKSDFDALNATYENYEKIKEELQLKTEQDYYVALKKNTLWRIAKLYGMTLEEIMSVNNLSSELIFINQPVIVIVNNKPMSDGYYRVVKGDTKESIAQQFGISKKQLNQLNEMSGYTLRKGMILQVKELN